MHAAWIFFQIPLRFEAPWAHFCTVLKTYWLRDFCGLENDYPVAVRQLAPLAVNKLDLAASAPSPFVYLVMNSYLGLEGCTAAILCVFVTLTKKTFLLIVSHGSRALSIHSLSCPSYWSSSSPNLSPIIPIRQVSSLIAWLQSGILMPPPQAPGSSEIRRGLDLGAWEVGWKCGGAQSSWLS